MVERVKRKSVSLESIPQEYQNPLAVTLWRIIDYHDAELASHCLRDAYLCMEVGLEMGLQDSELRDLISGALLHDFGKLDPDIREIASQSRPLNEYERLHMNEHPNIGAESLSYHLEAHPRLNYSDALYQEVWEALLIVRHHHERWDGSGYPSGLVGEEIPRLAQILGMVDWYVALREDRPYAASMPPTEAFNEVKNLAKNQILNEELIPFFRNVIRRLESEEENLQEI